METNLSLKISIIKIKFKIPKIDIIIVIWFFNLNFQLLVSGPWQLTLKLYGKVKIMKVDLKI